MWKDGQETEICCRNMARNNTKYTGDNQGKDGGRLVFYFCCLFGLLVCFLQVCFPCHSTMSSHITDARFDSCLRHKMNADEADMKEVLLSCAPYHYITKFWVNIGVCVCVEGVALCACLKLVKFSKNKNKIFKKLSYFHFIYFTTRLQYKTSVTGARTLPQQMRHVAITTARDDVRSTWLTRSSKVMWTFHAVSIVWLITMWTAGRRQRASGKKRYFMTRYGLWYRHTQ